ncbi:ELKS/Rab6-interacting/CAST family member 1 [Labrus bergylta]|uniref:ELKS/Rab6-interacting/CAST family member 1 n=1 Tax=Labrus bergylta TaxID=56723 RepID=UPI003313E5FB
MKGTAKSKVVTSGRLTGRVKVQPMRRRVSQSQALASRPEPAFSLYSTDSEDQVTTLHNGLDRCAALLSGILQADQTEPSPGVPQALKAGAAKSKPPPSQGKKTIKKVTPQTDQRICRSVQRAAGGKTPKTPHLSPAAHSGVKLQKHPRTQTYALQHLSSSAPHTATPPPSNRPPTPKTDCCSAPEAPNIPCKDGGEDEFVPVRDVDPQSSDTNTHTCTLKTPDMQLERAQGEGAPLQDSHRKQTEEKVRTAQGLLGELRAVIAGQGSAAEILLSHLEQTVSSSSSSSLMKAAGSDLETESELSSLQSQNTQLRRRVRTLQQQLKQREEAEKRPNVETLCTSEVLILQDELTVAQSQLQELQSDLTELREALQDTQSRLRESEAKNQLVLTDLEATRSRLLESEREKSELASVAQKRQAEIDNLNRILQSRDSSVCPPVVDTQTTNQHFKQLQLRQNPAAPPSDRITQYLLSMDQLERTHTEQEQVCVSADTDLASRPDITPADSSVRSDVLQLEIHRRQLFSGAPSLCDRESLSSDWSARSGSSFNTRDEVAFRDGLAALDASIASLQKTIQLDVRR